MNDAACCELFRRLALLAGREILTIYERGTVATWTKEDRSPLTEADLAAHRVIVAGITDLPVLSEENAEDQALARQSWGDHVLVDPLDGTKEFLARNGEFTVNLALVRAGRPVLGVVHAPVLGTTWWGQVGLGAWKQEGDAPPRPIRVAAQGPAVPRVVASRSHRGEHLDAFCAALGPHACVSMGSSLKLCLIAEDRADVYPRLGPTMVWDTAAAQAVVEAAGGQVVDLAGQPLHCQYADLRNPFFLACAGDPARWLAHLRHVG